MDWKKEKVKSEIPIRLVKRFNQHWFNLIVSCPSESTSHVRIVEKSDHSLELVSDGEMYIIGKEIASEQAPYDSWRCSCGAIWNSYHTDGDKPIELSL